MEKPPDPRSPEYHDLLRRHNPNLPSRTYGSISGADLRPREDAAHRNIFDIESVDTPIYRIIPLTRACDYLQTKTSSLTRTSSWGDPFENFLHRATAHLTSGESVDLGKLRDQYFGQCWTLNEETDAMWRIYSSSVDGVKLCSTVRKVFDPLYSQTEFPRVNCFAGLVRYLPEQQITAMMQNDDIANAMLFHSSGELQARSLLLKRLEFSHEAEVRFLRRIDEADPLYAEDYPTFAFDMNTMIDRIVLDPRCEDAQQKTQSNALMAAGFTGPIARSPLYRLPAMTITIQNTPPRFVRARAIWDALTIGSDPPQPDRDNEEQLD